jgi:predicted methyltransferase
MPGQRSARFRRVVCTFRAAVTLAALVLACVVAIAAPSAGGDMATLAAIAAGDHRTESNRARDAYRHPVETLAFFGLRRDMSVIEIWPGGSGWWTEILAPYLKERGAYFAAESTADSDEARTGRARLAAKLAADTDRYGNVIFVKFDPNGGDIVPPGTVDMVLTFRNLHNWIADGTVEATLQTFYKALKPGGVLGIEGHRGRADLPHDLQLRDGYVREDHAIAIVERAGFKLVGRSEINANPKDTKDYPAGVWTLPPTYRLKDQDRARYAAIGESDRFTLKFVKPSP